MFSNNYIPNPAQQVQLPTPQSDPPAYEDSLDSDLDLDDDEDDEDERPRRPLKLTINSASSVQGSNNLVQTPPPPFADISKLSTSLLEAMCQINAAVNTSAAAQGRRQHTLKLDLTINCGITVIGDRNVVGGIGLRHKGSAASTPGPNITADAPGVDAASGGAKRKAEDPPEGESELLVKRLAVDNQV